MSVKKPMITIKEKGFWNCNGTGCDILRISTNKYIKDDRVNKEHGYHKYE